MSASNLSVPEHRPFYQKLNLQANFREVLEQNFTYIGLAKRGYAYIVFVISLLATSVKTEMLNSLIDEQNK